MVKIGQQANIADQSTDRVDCLNHSSPEQHSRASGL